MMMMMMMMMMMTTTMVMMMVVVMLVVVMMMTMMVMMVVVVVMMMVTMDDEDDDDDDDDDDDNEKWNIMYEYIKLNLQQFNHSNRAGPILLLGSNSRSNGGAGNDPDSRHRVLQVLEEDARVCRLLPG